MIHRILIFILLLSICSLSQADNLKQLDLSLASSINTAFALQYYADTEGLNDLAQIKHIANRKWRDVEGESFNAGYTPAAIWLRFSVHNASGEPIERVIEAGRPTYRSYDVYYTRGDKVLQTFHLGTEQPYAQRPIKSLHFTTPLQLQAGENLDIYLRIKSDASLQVPLFVKEPGEFAEAELQLNILYGIYYGAIIIMVLFNLLVFSSVKERTYLYYVCFVGSFGLFQAALHGTAFRYLWPNSLFWEEHALSTLICISQFFLCLFAMSFLGLEKQQKNINKLLQITAAIYLLLLSISLFAEQRSILKISVGLSMLAQLLAIYGGYRSWRQGYRPATFFLIAWSVLFASLLVNALSKLGIVGYSLTTENSMALGSFMESFLLTLALADRFNHIRHEKNVSERKAMQAQMLARAKSEMLTVMSHEIRTPMNGVLGVAQLMRDTNLDEEQSQLLDTIDQSGRALLGLLNNVLDLSKLEAGKMQLESIELNLQNMLDETITMFSPMANEKKISLWGYCETNVPASIDCDPTRLRQILINLLGNSFKFTEHGSIIVCLSYQKPHLKLSVTDTGIGIADNIKQNLFMPFSQADSSTTREYGGTGLGLSISRMLTELMGGEIGVESRQHHGSTFWIRIPVKNPRPPVPGDWTLYLSPCPYPIWDAVQGLATQMGFTILDIKYLPEKLQEKSLVVCLQRHKHLIPTQWLKSALLLHESELTNPEKKSRHDLRIPFSGAQLKRHLVALSSQDAEIEMESGAPDLQHLKVLVAEDNSVNQLVIKGLLKKMNIQAVLTQTGEETLHHFIHNGPFDIVLMDCEMPVMDGYEASRRIRLHEQLHNLKHTPIIALSAHAFDEHKHKCLAAGMDEHISKPVDRMHLLAVFRHWCSHN